ncbi:uncharacterized protein LOC141652482 [Silene latifolia]|uniref:uncharacterized protein LOC141652482 n=1 Tax=Silene latifolia TaxID=37657 RepID=UPI003D77929D
MVANRIKEVLPTLVGWEQAAFVKDRDLFDNSSLVHELTAKYTRARITPRCLLKVDIRKAFDSVNWEFMKACLVLYGFPGVFVRWVMKCITSPHFSLAVNGGVEGFFKGQRGLRQGDPLSPYLFVLAMKVLSRLLRKLPTHPGFSYHPKCVQLHLTHLVFADDLLVFTRGDLPSVKAVATCLNEFAALSGLAANPMKTNVYFGGVGEPVKKMIMDATGFREGEFPFRYLGLPLTTSRFTAAMFNPMLDKIKAKIMHWANHSLSYAGKATLINSVIFGIQNFWGASILLPKGIVKKLQKICKDFFWGIAEGRRTMVFKGWTGFCLPRREGGLDIKEILSWNKCQMVRWIWKVIYKPTCLWSAWITHYMLKGESIWHATSSSTHSWFWKSVLLIKDMLLQFFGQSNVAKLLADCTQDDKLQMGMLFQILRTREPAVSWYRTIHDAAVLPKYAVIGILACQNKLAIVDNLKLRGIPLANRCVLCGQAEESTQHLFFVCNFSTQVWGSVCKLLGTFTPPSSLHLLLHWFKQYNRGCARVKVTRRCLLVTAIYVIWRERNARIFQGRGLPPEALIRKISYLVATRIEDGSVVEPPICGDGHVRFIIYGIPRPSVPSPSVISSNVGVEPVGWTVSSFDRLLSLGLRTAKSIPPKCRLGFARVLKEALNDVVGSSGDISCWICLLVLLRATLDEVPPSFHVEEDLDLSELNLRQRRRKICDGHYTAAVRVLSSSGDDGYANGGMCYGQEATFIRW